MYFILPEESGATDPKDHFDFVTCDIDFSLDDYDAITIWLLTIIANENKSSILSTVVYHFCSDDYLSKINVEYLKHKSLTDIISFQYDKRFVSGDIYISIERVTENSKKYNTAFFTELLRVMAHGILHFCGYKDKTKQEKEIMRSKEDQYIDLWYNRDVNS
jgi:probable rRNA maturation factor